MKHKFTTRVEGFPDKENNSFTFINHAILAVKISKNRLNLMHGHKRYRDYMMANFRGPTTSVKLGQIFISPAYRVKIK